MADSSSLTRRIHLLQHGLVFVDGEGPKQPEAVMRALDLQLAALGYALSTRLRDRLARLPLAELTHVQDWLWQTLSEHLGSHHHHVPVFRRFPHDIPADTEALWVRRFLAHLLQAPDQSCLFCRRVSTTHVLRPCQHVVCDRCFDGANYSACPICGGAVDRSAPFFKPDEAAAAAQPAEQIRFKLLDWGQDLEAATRSLVRALCERSQAMSPADVEVLSALVDAEGSRVLGWLPDVIPVRETQALVLARLVRAGVPVPMAVLSRHLTSATDILRFLAAYSGADPALQGDTAWRHLPGGRYRQTTHKRFTVAKLPRSLRKQVLGLLEALPEASLFEDMQRQRAYWVWLGEFLHPHEYASRFPTTARAFAMVRKRTPDGIKIPPFRGRGSRLEAALRQREAGTFIAMLAERPGELARRLDHALRLTASDPVATGKLLETFSHRLEALATPMLLTLLSHLPTRTTPAPRRIYWPKGAVARGISDADRRSPLAPSTVERLTRAIEGELLSRLAAKPRLDDVVVDRALETVMVPFNERTAARSAIALPRGSRIEVAEGKTVRLFLHWCQPGGPGCTTDLDLSVAFYDEAWRYVGVCSYYQLRHPEGGRPAVAVSAGDRTDAPPPEGATEFVDLDREMARAQGIRYAVMVVNAYSGLPFDRLERAWAGVMLRDDRDGLHFDPRTVALKFALTGQNGVFMPLVFDLEDATLHWLDVHAKGQFQINHVENSKKAIATVCPELMAYFASGARPTMYDLALLHAAARAERVFLRRGDALCRIERSGEGPGAFLARLRAGDGAEAEPGTPGAGGRSVLAVLHTGDLDLPEASQRYCLFPERVTGNMAASDLLS